MTIRSMTSAALGSLVVSTLSGYQFAFQDEKEFQAGIHAALSRAGLPVIREAMLGPGDIVDFLVADCVAVECKVGGSAKDVTAQLLRYAQHPSVEVLVLVSSCTRHAGVPPNLNGKPVVVYIRYRGLE